MSKIDWEKTFPEVPESVHNRIMDTLSELDAREGKLMKNRDGNRVCGKGKGRRGRTGSRRLILLAAALILLMGTTVLAAEIVIKGNIFGLLGGKYKYPGLDQVDKQVLQEEEEPAPEDGNGDTEPAKDAQRGENPYEITQGGLTITLSEAYATNQALFIGVCVKSEEEFPEIVTDSQGAKELVLRTAETYSFRPDTYRSLRMAEGELTDAHTFIGIVRIDYDSINVDSRAYDELVREAEANNQEAPEVTQETWDQYFSRYEIPEAFSLDLTIEEVCAYTINRDGAGKERLEEGVWEYSLELSQDTGNSRVIEVNETNEQGIGIRQVTLSRVEVSVEDICPAGQLTFVVALDADGEKLTVAGTNANQFVVQNRDIGTLYLYVCDYDEYMDEIKGYQFGSEDGKTFREVLEERALFKTAVKTD